MNGGEDAWMDGRMDRFILKISIRMNRELGCHIDGRLDK